MFFIVGYCIKFWFNVEWYIVGVWYFYFGFWAVIFRYKGYGSLWGWGYVFYDNLLVVVYFDVVFVVNGEFNERKD